MSWEAIEAISSAISAVGVIATLIYLAYQIRQNTHSLQGATEQSLMTLEKDTYSLIADNAELMIRASSDYLALSPEDALRFNSIVGAEMSLVYSAHVQYRRKLLSSEGWEAYERSTMEQFKELGFLSAWQSIKSGYPESFTNVVDRLEQKVIALR
ncbi:MAG: hypothetical protein V7720_06430 [Halioglobus sp.]